MEDIILKTYPTVAFGDDLVYCCEHGIIYQRDLTQSVDYGFDYFNNYVSREDTEIAKKLNRSRTRLAKKYCNCVIDIGVGSGEFIKKSKIKCYGFDINPYGVKWLEERGIFVDPYKQIPDDVEGWTLWDTLEHMPNPNEFLKIIPAGHYLLTSLPIFDDILTVRNSKHFKPNEHYLYFTHDGLVKFMLDSGFELVEANNMETRAGRESIGTFVFRKFV